MRLPRLLAAALLLVPLTFSPPAHAEQQEELNLVLGLGFVYDLHFTPCQAMMECVRISNKAIVQVQYSPEKRQLIFTPMARGETNVIVRDEKGDVALTFDVIVMPHNIKKLFDELSTLLKDIPGVTVKTFRDHIVIDGQVNDPAHLKRVAAVYAYPGMSDLVDDYVVLTKQGLENAAKEIQTEIGKPDIKVKPFHGSLIIEGHAKDAQEARDVVALARKLATAIGLCRTSKGEDPVISKL